MHKKISKPKNHLRAGKSTIPPKLLHNVRNRDHYLIHAGHFYSQLQHTVYQQHDGNTMQPRTIRPQHPVRFLSGPV